MIPLDWAELVLAEHATEDELDEDMTTVFWEWDGHEDGPTEEETE